MFSKSTITFACLLLACMSFGQTIIVSHNFDTSDEGWAVTTATNGNWTRSSDVLNAGSSGEYWHTLPVDRYRNNAVLLVESPIYDFTGQTNLVLQMDVRYDVEDSWDGMRVEYDDGGGYQTLGTVGDGFNWYNDTDVDAIGTNEPGWTGDNGNWETAIISLPASVENNATVRFRVRFESDGGIRDLGAGFDNFQIVSGGADILVAGLGNEISNGDNSPSELDNTDFRVLDVTSGSKVKTYTIVNVNGGTLNLTGGTPVTISGTHATDFSVISQPGVSTLNGGESTTFSIEFDPSATGVRQATVSIASDDPDENPFTFDIQGTGINAVVVHDFDASANGWTVTSNTNGNWARGTGIFSEGADGNYWHTTPTTGYNNNAVLVIQSPIIDLTGQTEVILYMDIRFETEADWDGFQVEYSADGGTNWSDLGAVGSGINWYNDTDVDAIANNADGWSGLNIGWLTAEIDLPVALENNNNTRYRVRFESDGNEGDVGVAFDNFMIAVGVPDISVEGNGLKITNGDNTPYNLDFTDFRTVDVNSGTRSHTFTIINRGGGTLNLTGGTPVTISGTHAADFTVTAQPASTVLTYLQSTTFTIEFNPSATGTRNATVSIASDDADDNPYTFAISGFGDNAVIFHDFNSTNNGWTVTSNTNGNWLWGNAILSTGADGNYWHTDPSNYSNNAALTLQSPTFDFTGMTNLALVLDIRYDTEVDWDGMKIEYSDDGGTSWFDLGQYLDDLNWYNDTDVDAFANQEDGWSGDNGAWTTSEIDLPAVLENNNQVVFRVMFASDANTTAVGVAFDNFAIYSDVAPLPVELVSFEVKNNKKGFLLQWTTATEINNDYFEVQHSIDGEKFKTIGTVSGKGTTSEYSSYEFIHDSPRAGANFYRLKQVDYDGQFEYSEIKRISWEVFEEISLTVFPNPAQDVAHVLLKDGVGKTFEILSLSGKVMQSEDYNEGSNTHTFDVSELKDGVYIIRISGAGQTLTKRLLINR